MGIKQSSCQSGRIHRNLVPFIGWSKPQLIFDVSALLGMVKGVGCKRTMTDARLVALDFCGGMNGQVHIHHIRSLGLLGSVMMDSG